MPGRHFLAAGCSRRMRGRSVRRRATGARAGSACTSGLRCCALGDSEASRHSAQPNGFLALADLEFREVESSRMSMSFLILRRSTVGLVALKVPS